MSATLDQVLATVTAEKTKIDGLIALLDGLKKQLADALANANLTEEEQAKVDEIFTQATANAQEIQDALTSNT